ncbi:MAG: hypothetical protein IPL08_17430 [Saprospiraceae bacterium]|nr:hypothetical protein [Saprospiraceae bacterium]
MKNLLQQLTFHGDPAVSIYKRSKPDYILDGSQSKMAENIISTKTDSVTFSIKLMNIGKNTPQKVKVKFEIKLPDHTVYFTRIDSFYVDKSSIDIAVKLPIGGQKAAGLNTLLL